MKFTATVEITPAQIATAMEDILRLYWSNTCLHEETHRGGNIWEICDSCGAKWADDEGGRPEYVEPAAVTKAEEMISLLKKVKESK